MRLSAPAKINLHLRVGQVQNDGFHPLLSWMTTVGLFDTITLEDAPSGIALTCDDPRIPIDATNLIVRAAQLMSEVAQQHKARPFRAGAGSGLQLNLAKRIPAGGGLGGGSSDAARILLALNQFWNLGQMIEQLALLAAKLGSDVPFFLFGPSSICQSRGEIVQPIAVSKTRFATLVLPDIAMPTPRVYQVFDSLGSGKAQADLGQPAWQEWTSLNAEALLPRLINDLEAPAFAISPQLGRLRNDIEQSLGRIVRMSGSGSTLFTLFDDLASAQRAAESVTRNGTRAIEVEIGITPDDDLEQSWIADA
ncbi:MAG TPA: 4-(cytidine 5'-diphospho)-2-C-methyl-D-erythritol kinase [Tepidisphaeraceae bacterium]|nr:4-(cytidine 5'-diphospho)-2-C-methyl-D-erythritol kinase [Tepidisphaeraceae bacterium]